MKVANDLIEQRERLCGEWEERYEEDDFLFRRKFYCSACGDWNTYGKSHFCPNCGAKMKKS